MSDKLEKLKEINAMIEERCTKIETEIFLKSSNSVDNTNTKSSNPKTLVETKH